MATLVFKDAYVSINSVDLSDHVRKVTINYTAEEQDDTNMGDTAKGRKAGLLDWKASVEFAQDFAGSSVDATCFPLVGAAAFAVVIRPVKGTVVGPTNPNYGGNAIMTEYTPMDGAVGTLATAPITLLGDGVLNRATS